MAGQAQLPFDARLSLLIVLMLLSGAYGVTHLRRQEEEQPDCIIEGNESLYGIGVRLDVYFQVFASMFTLAFQREQGAAFLYAAAALQCALFVALVYATVREHLFASEALVAILLLIIMMLFETLVFMSVALHLISGHFRIAKETDRTGSGERRSTPNLSATMTATSKGSQPAEVVTESKYAGDDRSPKAEGSKSRRGSSSGSLSVSDSGRSDLGLMRTKTRRLQDLEPTNLNFREAIYASDPLLLSDETLQLMARFVGIYAESHLWSSAIFVSWLLIGCYVYMMWFWWHGLSNFRPGPCGTEGFFIFASFEIDHWIKWPIRVVLTCVGVASLGFVFEMFCTCIAVGCVVMFELSNTMTDWSTRRCSALWRMRAFHDRVSQMGLPLTETYFLFILIYKFSLSHWPDRVFLSVMGKDPQKRSSEQGTADDNAESIWQPSGSSSAEERDSRHSRQDPPQAGGLSVERETETLAERSVSGASEQETGTITRHGVQIKHSAFFIVQDPPSWLFSACERLIAAVLHPQPSSSTAARNDEEGPLKLFVMPFEDNFETITVPLVLLLSHAMYFAVMGLLLAAGIWSVEVTIHMNHLSEVNHLPSTAQLITFIIGAGSLLQSILSALGSFMVSIIGIYRLRKGSRSWFEALVETYFFEASEDEGGVDVEYLHCSPLMTFLWMLLPSMRKGQNVGSLKEELTNEMSQRGGLFVLDLFD